MKLWTDRIGSTDQVMPQRFVLNDMAKLFDGSLSDYDIELIRCDTWNA